MRTRSLAAAPGLLAVILFDTIPSQCSNCQLLRIIAAAQRRSKAIEVQQP
jgi:hypothetical protein